VALFLGTLLNIGHLEGLYEDHRGVKTAYNDPVRMIAATRPLPETGWFESQKMLADDLISHLPAGATVASSEIGYMGAVSPQVNIIDLSGLNDPRIALHGFSPQEVIARKPDLIWLPVKDYTAMYGRLYAAPELLAQYTVLDGALNYGLAIRKDGPHREQIEASLAEIWSKSYPGYRMEDYVVQSASWDGRQHPVEWDGKKYKPVEQNSGSTTE
jgi:hypothetical protein